MQHVVSILSYENGIDALELLKNAFDFEENIDMRMIEDGRLTHAELRINDSIIMIATPTTDYESINKQRKKC